MSRRSSWRWSDLPDACVTLLSVLLASWLTASSALATVPEASFDYLYIESNEGGSSGGHTAIRFGSDVYHFQKRVCSCSSESARTISSIPTHYSETGPSTPPESGSHPRVSPVSSLDSGPDIERKRHRFESKALSNAID